MSQYGAYGAAHQGPDPRRRSSTSTTRARRARRAVGNPTVRVRLTALGTAADAGRRSAAGLDRHRRHANGLARTAKNSDGTLRTRWRVVPDGAGADPAVAPERDLAQHVRAGRPSTKPLSFRTPRSGKVRVVMPDGTQRDYRGTCARSAVGAAAMTLSVVADRTTTSRASSPRRCRPSWSAAALEAQAVAARTYAAYQRAHQPSGSLYDTCDSTACQVYRGLAGYTSTRRAGTSYEDAARPRPSPRQRARRLTYGGAPAFTEFSRPTAARPSASSLPYQVSKADPYDNVPSGSSSHVDDLAVDQPIEKAYPTIGTLRALRVDKRDGINAWGGRTLDVTVIGSAGYQDRHRRLLPLDDGPAQHVVDRHLGAGHIARRPSPRTSTATSRGDLLAVDTGGHLRLLSATAPVRSPRQSMGAGWGSLGLVAAVGPWDDDNRHDVIERDAAARSTTTRATAPAGLSRGSPSAAAGTPSTSSSGAGDIDGDGYTDFLARTTHGQLKVYRGDGAGQVAHHDRTSARAGTPVPAVLSPGDLTGDGKARRAGACATQRQRDAALPGHRHRQLGAPTAVAGRGPATAPSSARATSPATVATTSWPGAPPTARSSCSPATTWARSAQHSVVGGHGDLGDLDPLGPLTAGRTDDAGCR